MEVIYEKLYDRLIEKYAPQSIRMQVITGYGSGVFLEKVLKSYPHLKVDLFIGMAVNSGIPITDHQLFLNLVKTFSTLSVYYQVQGETPTHIKLVEFIDSDGVIKQYAGSANFTENGFERNRELMAECKFDSDALFSEQRRLSSSCDDERIEEFINLYASDSDLLEDSDSIAEEIVGKSDVESVSESRSKKMQKRTTGKLTDPLIMLRRVKDSKYFDSITVKTASPEKSYKLWDVRGINAWRQNRLPNIMSKTFKNFFPADKAFDIYFKDGDHYKANLTGSWGEELILLGDTSMYDLFSERIGLTLREPISLSMLEKAGFDTLKFTRYNETQYYAEFI